MAFSLSDSLSSLSTYSDKQVKPVHVQLYNRQRRVIDPMLTSVPMPLSQTHSVETSNQLAHGWGSVGHTEVCDSEERRGKLCLKQNARQTSRTKLNGVIIRALCLLNYTNHDTRTSVFRESVKMTWLFCHMFPGSVLSSDIRRER